MGKKNLTMLKLYDLSWSLNCKWRKLEMSQKRSGDPEIGKTLITLSKLLKARNFYVHIKPDQRYIYLLFTIYIFRFTSTAVWQAKHLYEATLHVCPSACGCLGGYLNLILDNLRITFSKDKHPTANKRNSRKVGEFNFEKIFSSPYLILWNIYSFYTERFQRKFNQFVVIRCNVIKAPILSSLLASPGSMAWFYFPASRLLPETSWLY